MGRAPNAGDSFLRSQRVFSMVTVAPAFRFQLGDILVRDPGEGSGSGNPIRNPGFAFGDGRIVTRLCGLARRVTSARGPSFKPTSG